MHVTSHAPEFSRLTEFSPTSSSTASLSTSHSSAEFGLCKSQNVFCGKYPRSSTCASLGAYAVCLVNASHRQLGGVMPMGTPFDSQLSSISIYDYIMRLKRYMNCSDTCFVLAGVYLLRCSQVFRVSYHSIHRLLLLCVVTAAKFIDDLFYPNSHYASVGGVTLKSFNSMEMAFLLMIDFRTHVSDLEFANQRSRQSAALHNSENLRLCQAAPDEIVVCEQLCCGKRSSTAAVRKDKGVSSGEEGMARARSSNSAIFSTASTATSTPRSDQTVSQFVEPHGRAKRVSTGFRVPRPARMPTAAIVC